MLALTWNHAFKEHKHIAEQKFLIHLKIKYLSKVLIWSTKVGCYRRSQHSHSLDNPKIMYKAPQSAAPPYSITRTAFRRLLHALGPAGQRKKGSTRHSNTTSTKCMKSNYNFGRASLSNVDSGAATMGGREGSRVREEGEEGLLLWERRGQPPRGCSSPMEKFSSSSFPSSWW
jgi:hypothetical protein